MIVEAWEGAGAVRIWRDRAPGSIPGDGGFMAIDTRSGAYLLGTPPVRVRAARPPGIDIGTPTRPMAITAFLAAAVAMTVVEFSYQGSEPGVAGLARAGGAGIGAVANGAWWKLLTANLLHADVVHLAMNSAVLFIMGRMLEHAIGWRLTAVVIAWSALLSSAGALLIGSAPVTIGASGVAFGLTGAAVAVDPRARTILGMTARQLVVLNIIFTFLVPNVSVGGHLGGLAAGLAVGALCWRGRLGRSAAIGRDDPRWGTPALLGSPRPIATVALGLAALPILLALAFGPRSLGGAGPRVQRAVVAPLLARQLRGGLSGRGGTGSIDVGRARCDGERDPQRYRCELTIHGDRVDGVVEFRRSDDQWTFSS